MVGLSFEAVIVFQSGGTLILLMALVLVFKAYEARTKDHRRTETWLCLSKKSGAPRPMPSGRAPRSCAKPNCDWRNGQPALPSACGCWRCLLAGR